MPDPARSNPAQSDPARRDEIYVGYLPVPRGQRAFLRWLIPTVGVMLVVTALLSARSQHSPGTGEWDTARAAHLHGILVARPYPMLCTNGSDGAPELVLLVEKGKHGARNVTALDGRAVIATGLPLHRDGRQMLELDAAESSVAVDPTAQTPSPIPTRQPMGSVTLRGEIIDTKCFFGAMKPGEGKTHKECATLCIRGGIPPMFITRDSAGRATYYLLQSPGDGPVEPAVYPFIADPVEITGDLSTSAGMNFLSIEAAAIERL